MHVYIILRRSWYLHYSGQSPFSLRVLLLVQIFVPIPKPEKDHSLCKNYRPIALLSCVGKLMERIITKRLMWYLNEHHLLHQDNATFQEVVLFGLVAILLELN